jgi:hypothetical protein
VKYTLLRVERSYSKTMFDRRSWRDRREYPSQAHFEEFQNLLNYLEDQLVAISERGESQRNSIRI